MQVVSVETLSDLERRVTVRVPAEEVARKVQDELRSLSRRTKVNGFRPGKAPLKLIQQMYGEQIHLEVVTELMERSLRDALVQEKLDPVGGPKVESKSLALEDGADLEYSATFEVIPEFEPTGFEHIRVERPVAEVTDQDVDEMIETLRQQHVNWQVVERPAQNGDRVRFDFEGKLDGQDFPGNQGKGVQLILGKGSMLADFEAQLIGLAAGAAVAFDLTFPADYHAAEVASKTARFTLQLHQVEGAELPEIDEAFAQRFDVLEGGVPALRQSLRENMERELDDGIQAAIKRQVMQGLLENNTVALPQALIAAEVERLAQQLRFPAQNQDEQIQELKWKLFETEARRRVALGLLISRIATAQGIKPDERRVRARLDRLAGTYEEPEQVVRWYESTPEALENLRAAALEEQVVTWVLEQAQLSDRSSSFSEVMKPPPETAVPQPQQQPEETTE